MLFKLALIIFIAVNAMFVLLTLSKTLRLLRTEGFLRPPLRLWLSRFVSRYLTKIGPAVFAVLLVGLLFYLIYCNVSH